MSIDASRRGFLGGIAATLLVTSAGVRLAVPTPKPLLAANGWPICNGQKLLRVDFPELFKVIGNAYGGGDRFGGNYFTMPDLSNNMPIFGGPPHQLVYVIAPHAVISGLPPGTVLSMLMKVET